jgi:hypothetical protein
MRSIAEHVKCSAECLYMRKKSVIHEKDSGNKKSSEKTRLADVAKDITEHSWAQLTGGTLMSAYISLHAAEAGAVLLLDTDQLKARLSSIYEQAVPYLPKGDMRLTALNGLMNAKTAAPGRAGNWIAWEAPTYANKIEDQQQLQVRHFRTMLAATFVGALMVSVSLGIVAHFASDYLPLCLATSKTATICPSGASKGSSSDVPLVLGMGAFDAALSVVVSFSGLKPPGVRYSLSTVQGLLKIAFGALTAFLGIMVLSTLASSDITALNSQLKLLVAAAVFGYSQQLLTSVLDRKATSLQNAAAGK